MQLLYHTYSGNQFIDARHAVGKQVLPGYDIHSLHDEEICKILQLDW